MLNLPLLEGQYSLLAHWQHESYYDCIVCVFFDNGIILRPYVEWNVGQASKGIRWMPWHAEAMKDVANCDKPRGAVSTR